MDSLFDDAPDPADQRPLDPVPPDGPLAARLRPQTLDDYVGQSHLLAPGTALRTAIEAGHPPSMLLHGPPGTGKTTLARLAAHHADMAFEELSAVNAGKAEVRAVLDAARLRRDRGRGTLFFLDEIHRFNKAQQDQLLPAVEDGTVTLIGATTENPYFEVNSALISRLRVYALEALTPADLEVLLQRGVEALACDAGPEVLAFLAGRANGDARSALNALELACETADGPVTLQDAEDAMQRRALRYDKAGDQHYDFISAWIKSTRGSDPDASIYYLVAMLEAGEDARFIARRMVILASEDIGNADPQALVVAVAATQAVEHVGLPEARFALVQAAIYLSLAPKSDAAKRALGAAVAHIRRNGAAGPPAQLQSVAFPGARGARTDADAYDSPHAHPGHVNDQEHLPAGVGDLRFYDPDDADGPFRERLRAARRARGRPD